MTIGDILEAKGNAVATIDGDARVGEAVAEPARHGIGALVVSSGGRHIDGIVSERDIVRRLDRERKELLDHPVRDILSTPVQFGHKGRACRLVSGVAHRHLGLLHRRRRRQWRPGPRAESTRTRTGLRPRGASSARSKD